jgi:hypothetical protein
MQVTTTRPKVEHIDEAVVATIRTATGLWMGPQHVSTQEAAPRIARHARKLRDEESRWQQYEAQTASVRTAMAAAIRTAIIAIAAATTSIIHGSIHVPEVNVRPRRAAGCTRVQAT